MFDPVMQDLRHSARMLLARPAFTLTVVLTLALGIGANTAVFSAIHSRLLKPLPYPHSEQLVAIYNSYPKMGVEYSGTTVVDYLDRREQATALADSAIYYDYSFDLTDAGPPQRVPGVATTPSLFTTLGVGAALGRTFAADAAQPGNAHVLLLSDALWRNHFAADPSIVGRDVRVSGQPYRVIGVMPAAFAFPRREVQLWVPFVFSDKQKSDAMRGFEFADSIGRLRPGADTAQLDAQFDAIVQRNLHRLGTGAAMSADFVARVASTGFTGRSRGLQERLSSDVAAMLWLLQAAVALVLVIASANVANLMLTRLSTRERELGMRAALGASPQRLAQQTLMEGLLLAMIGGVVGIAVAYGGIALMRALALDGGELGFQPGLGRPVLAFALAATLLTSLACALTPVLALTRADRLNALHVGARGGMGSRPARLTRQTLVVVQIALAVVLLVAAGLLLHSFWRLQQVNPGFNSAHVVSANINLSRDRYRDVASTEQFYQRLMAAVRALPGVSAAGVVSSLPFSSDHDTNPYFVEYGGHRTDAPARSGYYKTADEDFFRTLQIPLLQGRAFQASDRGGTLPVAIIDQNLANTAFAGRNPLGARIATRDVNGTLAWKTIVGVVTSVAHQGLSERGEQTYYFPHRQQPTRIFRLVIKSALPAADLVAPLRGALAQADPEQPIWDVLSMDQRIDRSLDTQRTPMRLVLLFAGVAVGLCAVGLYGVLAFSVAQRKGEIGVRMSLGANRTDILRWVLADGARLLSIGLAIGTPLALALTRWLRSQLFDTPALDPLAIAAALALIAAIALLACWIPARQAASVSPLEALRHD